MGMDADAKTPRLSERWTALIHEAVAAEREACAKIAEAEKDFWKIDDGMEHCDEIAAAIRARK